MLLNKKLICSSVISITIHIVLGVFLYNIIIKKDKYFNIIHNAQLNNTITSINANIPHDKQNQDSLSTKRIRITDTQHPAKKQKTPSQADYDKQNQDINLEKNEKIGVKSNNIPLYTDNELKNLINTLVNAKNVTTNQKELKVNEKIKKNNNYFQDHKINIYKKMISESIQNKFYNASNYIGKQCNLYMQLNPDGTLLSVTAVSGDPTLCQAAIIATKSAILPKPPNIHIYEIFKNIKLNFSPQ